MNEHFRNPIKSFVSNTLTEFTDFQQAMAIILHHFSAFVHILSLLARLCTQFPASGHIQRDDVQTRWEDSNLMHLSWNALTSATTGHTHEILPKMNQKDSDSSRYTLLLHYLICGTHYRQMKTPVNSPGVHKSDACQDPFWASKSYLTTHLSVGWLQFEAQPSRPLITRHKKLRWTHATA